MQTNEILASIEDIEQNRLVAECDVLTSLASAYAKSAMILENCDETTDLSAFDIFQEGYFKKDGEGVLKTILMFIPRLIVGVLGLAIGIVVLIVKIVLAVIAIIIFGPIMLIGGVKVGKKIKKEVSKVETIELDFNPEFIIDLTRDLQYLVKAINDKIKSGPEPIPPVTAIWSLRTFGGASFNGKRYDEFLKSINDKLHNFSKAYEKTTMTRQEVTNLSTEIKKLANDLQADINEFKKYEKMKYTTDVVSPEGTKKNITVSLEDYADEDVEALKNFNSVISLWANKYSELAKKLKDIEKASKKAKGTGYDTSRFEEALGGSAFKKQYDDLSDWVDKNGDDMVKNMKARYDRSRPGFFDVSSKDLKAATTSDFASDIT